MGYHVISVVASTSCRNKTSLLVREDNAHVSIDSSVESV